MDKKMDLEIKHMQKEDLDKVMEIENSVFTAPWDRKGFETELNLNRYSRYYVVYSNDKLLGYAGIWAVLYQAHLTTLAVSSENRRMGIGSLLLRTLIIKAAKEGLTHMTLEVRPSNKVARNFYEKHGFSFHSIREEYYPDKEDAIIMVNANIARAGLRSETI